MWVEYPGGVVMSEHRDSVSTTGAVTLSVCLCLLNDYLLVSRGFVLLDRYSDLTQDIMFPTSSWLLRLRLGLRHVGFGWVWL